MSARVFVFSTILVGALVGTCGTAPGQVGEHTREKPPPRPDWDPKAGRAASKELQIEAQFREALRGALGVPNDREYWDGYRETYYEGPFAGGAGTFFTWVDNRTIETWAESLAAELDAEAIPFLAGLICDRESLGIVRYRLALVTLGKLADRLEDPEIFTRLLTEHPRVRADALLLGSYVSPEMAETVLSRLAAGRDGWVFRSVSLEAISRFDRQRRDVVAGLEPSEALIRARPQCRLVDGDAPRWVDAWSLEKPAEDLATAFGAQSAPFLAEVVANGSRSIDRALALMTLAKLGPPAVDPLYRLLYARESEDRPLPFPGAAAISFMDLKLARPLLARLAGRRHPETAALVSLLVVIGDDQSFRVLCTLLQRWKRHPPPYGVYDLGFWLTGDPGYSRGEEGRGGYGQIGPQALEMILKVGPDERPAGWRRQEVLYWQALNGGGLFPTMIGRAGYLRVACRLQHHELRFTPEFLRSKLPARMAMAIAGVQKEASLIPDLDRIAANGRGDRERNSAKAMVEAIQAPPSTGPDTKSGRDTLGPTRKAPGRPAYPGAVGERQLPADQP